MKLGAITNIFRNAIRLGMTGFVAVAMASCGGGGGSPGTVSGSSGSTSTTPASISLLFSSTDLASSGATGTEVTITALVKNANNNALASIPVTFSASSGALTGVDTATNASGQAKASLGTSGDRTNRAITVTARAGNFTATGTVNVVGSKIAIVGPSAITSGGTADYLVTVKDSTDAAVPNVSVTFSTSNGSPIAVSGGGAAVTDVQGTLKLRVTGSQSGAGTISVSAQGANAAQTFSVNPASLTVKAVDGSTPANTVTQANITSGCTKITATYLNNGVPQTGTVNITTSRGTLHSASSCLNDSLKTSSSVSVTAGESEAVYIKSETVGTATITATVVNGPTAQTNLAFVAALTDAATINLQADLAVIGPNAGTSQSEQSTLTAIVRDGTPSNNLVEGANVEFSILQDQSGGSLSNPSVVPTASNGAATVSFIAGPAPTATDGALIQARIQGKSISHTTTVSVARKSLFISAGTGNTIVNDDPATYRKDYSVFVTDASGNPVPNVTITAAVRPTVYRKGFRLFDAEILKYWVARTDNPTVDPVTGLILSTDAVDRVCDNEDSNQNGILDTGEDFSRNGRLDPGIPLNVSSSGTTDATGTATVSLRYARDRGDWTDIVLTIRGSVAGTESVYKTPEFTLPVLSADVNSNTTAPPGPVSPYGRNACSDPD